MKKILVFALICTMILGAAMAETVTETAVENVPATMPCQMAENNTCPMAENCQMMNGEGVCVMETCPKGEGECTCTGENAEECASCAVCGIATTEEPVYMLPESDIRLIEKEELEGVDKETLALMRNEILARHGYPFKKAQYQEYFGSQIWYEENPDFDYNMLSKIEMENVETIKKLEEAK